jgi:HEPN domain-containing protein
VEPSARNWLELAQYDLAAAADMLDRGRTLYVVFTCQQAAEKALKA